MGETRESRGHRDWRRCRVWQGTDKEWGQVRAAQVSLSSCLGPQKVVVEGARQYGDAGVLAAVIELAAGRHQRFGVDLIVIKRSA